MNSDKNKESVKQIGNSALDFSNRSFIKLSKFIYKLGRKKIKYEMGNFWNQKLQLPYQKTKSYYHLLLGREVDSAGNMYVMLLDFKLH